MLFLSSFYTSRRHPDLHSFPTRRSSDLRNGSTPLHRAVTQTGAPGTAGRQAAAIEIIRLLLAAGADPSITNKSDRKSTRLNSSHQIISYAVFCLKKKEKLDNDAFWGFVD